MSNDEYDNRQTDTEMLKRYRASRLSITHPESWYHALAAKLGHPGFVTLADIVLAESETK